MKVSFWSAAASMVQKGFALLTIPVFTRLMAPSEFGAVTMYQSMLFVATVLITLNLAYEGVNNGFTKFDAREGYLASLQGLTLCLSMVIAILAAGSAIPSMASLSTVVVFAMIVQVVFTNAYDLWAARERFEFRYRAVLTVAIGSAVLIPLAGVVAIKYWEPTAQARIVSGAAACAVLFGPILVLNFVRGRSFFSRTFWMHALLLGLPLLPYYISRTSLNVFDRLLIGTVLGEDAVAVYSLGYSVGMLVSLVSIALNSSLLPWTYRALKSGRIERLSAVGTWSTVMVAALTTLVVALGPELVALLGPPAYQSAIYVVPPVALACLLLFVGTLFSNALLYWYRTKHMATISVVVALVNIVSNVILVPTAGYIVAAYTTLVSYGLLASLYFWLLRRRGSRSVGGTPIYKGKPILLIFGLSVMVAATTALLYGSLILRFGFLVLASGLIAAFAGWRFRHELRRFRESVLGLLVRER